jgi:hypothetical protein
MNIMSWNYRGLGQAATVQELSRLVRKFCPKIVFLLETRQQKGMVSNLCGRIGLKNALIVDGQGKGGGLMLYWDESIKIPFCCIDCIILTLLYGMETIMLVGGVLLCMVNLELKIDTSCGRF